MRHPDCGQELVSFAAGKWGDSNGIALNGSQLDFQGNDAPHFNNRELVGAVTFEAPASHRSRGNLIQRKLV